MNLFVEQSEVKVAINLVLYCITKLATVQGENHRDVLYLSTVSERPFAHLSPPFISFSDMRKRHEGILLCLSAA